MWKPFVFLWNQTNLFKFHAILCNSTNLISDVALRRFLKILGTAEGKWKHQVDQLVKASKQTVKICVLYNQIKDPLLVSPHWDGRTLIVDVEQEILNKHGEIFQLLFSLVKISNYHLSYILMFTVQQINFQQQYMVLLSGKYFIQLLLWKQLLVREKKKIISKVFSQVFASIQQHQIKSIGFNNSSGITWQD